MGSLAGPSEGRTVSDLKVVDTAKRCHVRQDSCACLRPTGHTGPHVCDCGGSWAITDKGFRYYTTPRREFMLNDETVEAYAATVPTEPANPLYDMWLALGGQEDEEEA